MTVRRQSSALADRDERSYRDALAKAGRRRDGG